MRTWAVFVAWLGCQSVGAIRLSVPTVTWHLYDLYAKLKLKSRAAAVVNSHALGALRST